MLRYLYFSGNTFTGHMLRSCENASHKLAGDKTTGMGAFFCFFSCYEVCFKAIDLPLGNMFCSLTGPGNDAMSQVMFPFQTPSASLCLTLPHSASLRVALRLRCLPTASTRRQKHRDSDANPRWFHLVWEVPPLQPLSYRARKREIHTLTLMNSVLDSKA